MRADSIRLGRHLDAKTTPHSVRSFFYFPSHSRVISYPYIVDLLCGEYVWEGYIVQDGVKLEVKR